MTELRKAAEQAATDLEELIHWHGVRDSNDKLMPAHNQTPEIKSAIETLETLRQALAQPEQEPAAWQDPQYKTLIEPHKAHPDWIPLYTAPSSIEAAVLAEREACAKVCDLVAKEIDDTNGIATYCAAAIRARSEK